MPRRIVLLGLILAMSGLMNAASASAQAAPGQLRPDEYDTVALIYNRELSGLGEKALYPICIDMPADMHTKHLVRYLRKGGFEISDPSVCEPAMARGGQHHPKDYPHGLRIFIDKPERNSGGVIGIHVITDDVTARPGEHMALTLRRGTYHFKQNEAGEWQIIGYTKEFDSDDNCDCAHSAPK